MIHFNVFVIRKNFGPKNDYLVLFAIFVKWRFSDGIMTRIANFYFVRLRVVFGPWFSSVWAGNFEGGGTCLRVRGPIKPLPLKPLWTSLHYVTKGFMVGAYLHPSKRAVLENYSPTYERFCYWTNESSQPMLRKWLPNFVPSFKQWSSLDQWKFILRWTTRWWLVGSF